MSCTSGDSVVQEQVFVLYLVPSLDLISHWGQLLEAQCLQEQEEQSEGVHLLQAVREDGGGVGFNPNPSLIL